MAAFRNLIVIGASTGGVKVVQTIFRAMPSVPAAIVVVQHMPAYIAEAFRSSVGSCTDMPVALARDGQELAAGQIIIAPGDVHLVIEDNLRVRLRQGPKVNWVRPSIDVAMKSVARPPAGGILAGVLLTGMGNDGAAGISHIKSLGGVTIAQEETTCPVFGMPKEAIRTGDVDYVLSPPRIAEALGIIGQETSPAMLERRLGAAGCLAEG